MKKLKLNVANLEATEILSREELKKVLGGSDGSGSGSGSGNECSSLVQSTCLNTVKCHNSDTGYEGKCTWIIPWGRCMCATIEPD